MSIMQSKKMAVIFIMINLLLIIYDIHECEIHTSDRILFILFMQIVTKYNKDGVVQLLEFHQFTAGAF